MLGSKLVFCSDAFNLSFGLIFRMKFLLEHHQHTEEHISVHQMCLNSDTSVSIVTMVRWSLHRSLVNIASLCLYIFYQPPSFVQIQRSLLLSNSRDPGYDSSFAVHFQQKSLHFVTFGLGTLNVSADFRLGISDHPALFFSLLQALRGNSVGLCFSYSEFIRKKVTQSGRTSTNII